MVECCWSFGNKGFDYIYGKEIEELKRLCSELVINKSGKAQKELKEKYNFDFDIPKGEIIYDRYLYELKPKLREIKKRIDLERLERLQRLERLERLQRLERLERLQITNLDYKDIKITTPLSETIIYCDPPYRETAKYVSGDFDFEEFDRWFQALPCTGFLSEYNSPHKKIFELEKRVLLSSGGGNKKAIEKLYWNEK